MIEKIKQNIWKISFKKFGSNVYLIVNNKLNKKILIDTSSRWNKRELVLALKELKIDIKDINAVLLTHWHFDHVGNLELFKNAEIFISDIEIKNFKLNKLNVKFKKLGKEIFGMKVIETPGHTAGSVCFLFDDVLFSGDTLFDVGYGRTDLATGSDQDMKKSLRMLKEIKYEILCAGH